MTQTNDYDGVAPIPVGAIDPLNPENETRLISRAGAGSMLRVRRTAVNWGVICLIDQIQREHAAAQAEAAEEARQEEAQAVADTRRHQHPLGG